MAVQFILSACADVIFAPDPARGRLSLTKDSNTVANLKLNRPVYTPSKFGLTSKYSGGGLGFLQ